MTVEALLAVDCDHRHEQHDPVSDNNGCGRGSDWHKSAMFLCTSSKCAVSICEDCHIVLNAQQARSKDCNARLIEAVARGFLARREAEARRQMDGARATT